MTGPITYGHSADLWHGYQDRLERLVRHHGFRRILDVGGGANPLLSTDFVEAHHLDYTIWDVSQSELDKAPAGYRKVVQDITAESTRRRLETFDLIFTKMLAEHVRDGLQLHRNIFGLLAQGGMAVHFFPTLYTLPFVVNRMVPESLASRLLDIFSPRDRHQHGKFPAYYSWCRGPTMASLRRLERLGYDVVEYQGGFGHGYYRKIPLVHRWHGRLTRFLLKHPTPYLTSYACVVVRRPEGHNDRGSR